ncbi:hypothetical protein [Paenibacillus pabuli]|uniref:hypothetical protein n=1 Tax=Paenibacillus pabuli TaxID=1472 RepID=UPI001FFF739B|nr:hypothetical protein [Paenibacillus pabuli]UPK45889.1 hypothetical protein KET34_10735 [Paenibacillus pabuli]
MELLQDLKTFLEDLTKDMSLGDEKKPPSVHIGFLPLKVAGPPDSPEELAVPAQIKGYKNVQTLPADEMNAGDFPFIILRATEVNDEWEGSQEKAFVPVKLMFATRSTDEDGYRDILHLAQVMRQAFLESPMVGVAAEAQRPIKTIIHEEQPYPQWVGEMRTIWSIPSPTRKVDFINGYQR